MTPTRLNRIIPLSACRGAVAAVCLAGTLVAGGCGTTTQRSGSLDQALAAYQTHRFSTAHSAAVDAMRSANGRQREQAAYIAGLSAFQLGDFNEAELRLALAANSTDIEVASGAKAMLGQLRLDQRRPVEAARLFEEAARGLSGADARQAARYAAIAHEQAGNGSAAAQWTSTSMSAAAGSGFALQVGAFHERHRASEAARQAEQVAEGLGPVNVHLRSDARGRTMYVVQVGRFDTRSAAAQARARLGRLDYIVAPIAGAGRY